MSIFGKKKVFLKTKALIIILSVFCFLRAEKTNATNEDIIITEIMFDPIKGGKNGDWIEIYNNSEDKITLDKKYLKLGDGEKNSGGNDRCHSFNDDLDIESGEYVIIASDKKQFEENFCQGKENCKYEGKVIDSTFLLPNDDKKIKISFDKCESWKYEISYKIPNNSQNGYSIERDIDDDKWERSYVYGGTPGKKKSEPKKYPSEIRINELVPNPDGNDNGNEYVELYNFSGKDIDLNEGWMLADADRKNKKELGNSEKIEGIIENNDYLEIKNSVFLNNDWDVIYLFDPNGKEVNKVEYEDIKDGFSYSFDGKNWKWTSFLTGGDENKFEKEKEYGKDVLITEFLPDSSGEESENEFIELYNNENKEVNLNGWTLKDSGSGKGYLIDIDLIIDSKKYLVIYRNDFDFALNNFGDEDIFLLDSRDTVIDSVKYNGCKENVSYSFDGKKWRQSRFLTPGAENMFNNLPEVKIEVEDVAYQDIYADFEVEAKDKDKNKLKFVWDFGDGHKSYLEKTRHKYEKIGKYFASVKVSDGSEDVVKNFTINVEKYPHREVKIVELMPNPEGLDSENEYIVVKNNSKHIVDLKGWSVATGISEKKLVNHPIYNSIKIKPGETKKITRKDSYFSLGNKQAYIQLRYPNGKVACSLKYKEKESIKDNSIFQKEKGKRWEWTINETKEQVNNETSEQNDSVNVIPDQVRDIDGSGENDDYTGKTTQKPVEIEITPEVYQKLSKEIKRFNDNEMFSGFSVRQEDGRYFFVAKTADSEHYAKKFLRQLLEKINIILSKYFV